jgi:hypothetical protein
MRLARHSTSVGAVTAALYPTHLRLFISPIQKYQDTPRECVNPVFLELLRANGRAVLVEHRHHFDKTHYQTPDKHFVFSQHFYIP